MISYSLGIQNFTLIQRDSENITNGASSEFEYHFQLPNSATVFVSFKLLHLFVILLLLYLILFD